MGERKMSDARRRRPMVTSHPFVAFVVGAAIIMWSAPRAAVAEVRDAMGVSASCTTAPVLIAAEPGDVRQVVTVVATRASTVATVALWSRVGACLTRVGGPWPAEIGRSGLSPRKAEGDGSTPMGTYSIGAVMYGVAPNPGVAYAYHRLRCGDWWDEAPSSPMYNRFVHVRCGTSPPFGGGSEALWKVVPQYNYFAVIDYNASPIVPGRGSAIFLHVSSGVSTAGCVALPVEDLIETLRWLLPRDHPVIAIGFPIVRK